MLERLFSAKVSLIRNTSLINLFGFIDNINSLDNSVQIFSILMAAFPNLTAWFDPRVLQHHVYTHTRESLPAADVLINAALCELITRRGWGTKTYSQKVTMTTCLNRSVSTNERRLWQANYNNRESARDMALRFEIHRLVPTGAMMNDRNLNSPRSMYNACTKWQFR